jgi:hypothetical protein
LPENNEEPAPTHVISRHLERLREVVLKYHVWFDTDNHAEATAMILADCRMLLADLDTDHDEVDRFVETVNLRRVAPSHADDEIPPIACHVTLDDLAEDESADG